MKKCRFRNHIVICGWNRQGEQIVHQLIKANKKTEICILARENLDENILPQIVTKHKQRMDFVEGDPVIESALQSANIEEAQSAIILTDDNKDANEADMEALMMTLAIEKGYPAVHTSVQIRNADNRIHIERAGADEIVCYEELGAHIVASSSLHHSVSHVLHDLLSFDPGSEFYRVHGNAQEGNGYKEWLAQASNNGKIKITFRKAVELLNNKGFLLIGIEKEWTRFQLEEIEGIKAYNSTNSLDDDRQNAYPVALPRYDYPQEYMINPNQGNLEIGSFGTPKACQGRANQLRKLSKESAAPDEQKRLRAEEFLVLKLGSQQWPEEEGGPLRTDLELHHVYRRWVIVNPRLGSDLYLKPNDAIFVIAQDPPRLS